MRQLQGLVLLGAGAALAVWSSLATAEPIYRYCMIGTPNSSTNCIYSTLQQCQIAASAGAGFCQENNFYVARHSVAAEKSIPPVRARR